MQTIESVRRKIQTAEDLHSVVKTMKALAAVSIRQYERAVQALAVYNQTIELGLQIVLRAQDAYHLEREESGDGVLIGAIVFGSDQGLCGQFNERIVTHALDHLNGMQVAYARRRLASVGLRSAALLSEADLPPSATLLVPSGIAGITQVMHELLLTIEEWRLREGVDRIILYHNHPLEGAAYQSRTVRMLPLSPTWLAELRARPWSTNMLPSLRTLPDLQLGWNDLFSALVRQHMFVTLYRACAESMASEEASRLAAMQNAERNIEERLQELTHAYHHQRQTSIMAELLDITAGYEAVMRLNQ